jgi:hypothetical protein
MRALTATNVLALVLLDPAAGPGAMGLPLTEDKTDLLPSSVGCVRCFEPKSRTRTPIAQLVCIVALLICKMVVVPIYGDGETSLSHLCLVKGFSCHHAY